MTEVVTRFVRLLCRVAFTIFCFFGRPFRGIRPRRLYHWLARRAFDVPEFRWYANRWGNRLLLSPYYFLDRHIIAFGTYDECLHLFIDKFVNQGMICLDIGANIGEVSLHLALKVGSKGEVYSFEPVFPLFERLRKNVRRNGLQNTIRTYQLALSNQTGTSTMSYADSTKENQGMGSLCNRDNAVVSLTQSVETMTIDTFVEMLGIKQIDLIKIDVQGAEIYVLEGGKETFSSLCPDLLVELAPNDLGCIGKDSRDLLRVVERYGYETFKIRNGAVGQRITADTVRPDFCTDNIYCTKAASYAGACYPRLDSSKRCLVQLHREKRTKGNAF